MTNARRNRQRNKARQRKNQMSQMATCSDSYDQGTSILHSNHPLLVDAVGWHFVIHHLLYPACTNLYNLIKNFFVLLTKIPAIMYFRADTGSSSRADTQTQSAPPNIQVVKLCRICALAVSCFISMFCETTTKNHRGHLRTTLKQRFFTQIRSALTSAGVWSR